MSSIKELKKEIKYLFGDIMDAAFEWEIENPEADTKKSQQLIDEVIITYDDLLARINNKKDHSKAHFMAIRADLETKAIGLVEKLNGLGS